MKLFIAYSLLLAVRQAYMWILIKIKLNEIYTIYKCEFLVILISLITFYIFKIINDYCLHIYFTTLQNYSHFVALNECGFYINNKLRKILMEMIDMEVLRKLMQKRLYI